jgi:hypothetical protein
MSKSILLIGLLFSFWDGSATKVYVAKRFPEGWYLDANQDQRGRVHQDHVALREAQAAPNARARAGFILIVIGAVLMAQYFVPMLPKLAALLILFSSAVVLLDIAFRLGVLYSVLLVTFALLLTMSFLRRKKKNQVTSSEKASPITRKAA